MVPQGIRPVVQLTAIEVIQQPQTLFLSELTYVIFLKPHWFVLPCPDSSVGPEEHEVIPAGHSVLTQPGGGVWRKEGGVSRHQEL